jgi:hypothetical protein
LWKNNLSTPSHKGYDELKTYLDAEGLGQAQAYRQWFRYKSTPSAAGSTATVNLDRLGDGGSVTKTRDSLLARIDGRAIAAAAVAKLLLSPLCPGSLAAPRTTTR